MTVTTRNGTNDSERGRSRSDRHCRPDSRRKKLKLRLVTILNTVREIICPHITLLLYGMPKV